LLLSVQGLRVYYGSGKGRGPLHAVDDFSFDMNEGEIVALVGESGSGKTTVSLSIARLLPPVAKVLEGKIYLGGKDLLSLTNDEMRLIRGKDIGMVFQDPTSFLNPVIKVGDQIAETLVIHEKLSKEDAKTKAKEILEVVRVPDLDRVYDSYAYQLSGGMAQRIVIGIAIACRPRLLIADEPTSNLDVTVQSQILHLLKNLATEFKMSMLLITHDLGVVSGMADRVLVMYAGKIAEEGPTSYIFSSARHPYTKLLLSSSGADMRKEAPRIRGSLPELINPPPGCRFLSRCPYGMEICKTDPLLSFPSPESRVYCWLENKGGVIQKAN
jgi:peptide/nickel transport system ATP-binding protein